MFVHRNFHCVKFFVGVPKVDFPTQNLKVSNFMSLKSHIVVTYEVTENHKQSAKVV
jgi:hypothetical protein